MLDLENSVNLFQRKSGCLDVEEPDDWQPSQIEHGENNVEAPTDRIDAFEGLSVGSNTRDNARLTDWRDGDNNVYTDPVGDHCNGSSSISGSVGVDLRRVQEWDREEREALQFMLAQ